MGSTTVLYAGTSKGVADAKLSAVSDMRCVRA